MPALGAHAPASWTCPQALSTASRRVQATPPDGCGRGTVAGPHSGGDRRPRGAVRPASCPPIAIRWLRHPVDAQPNAVPPPLAPGDQFKTPIARATVPVVTLVAFWRG